METPEKILADLLGTTEEYISKNAQSNPPYEGEYFVYIEAMKKYADTKVKNLVKPDVSGQLPAVLKKLYELSNEYREMKSYNSQMENESNTEVLQREFHQRWTLCLRFHNDIDTMIRDIEACNFC